MRERILVIDDQSNIVWLFHEIFGGSYDVLGEETGEQGLETAKTQEVHLIMLDLRLPGISGLETLKKLRTQGYRRPVIIMTAYGEVRTAVKAMKSGAHDYITKPFDLEELKHVVEGALRYSRLSIEVTRLRRELEEKFHLKNIITVSPKILSLFSVIERVSTSDVCVLLEGESGTGKEIFAKAIHYASPRKDKPFVPVNCAALPEHLLESELFGYEQGAFSGARKPKPGKFEIAYGGTVFLDEVGELPLSMQPKILRVLEEKEIDRLGGTRRLPIDVRIVAASNKNLREEVRSGRFRQDLYFRLAVLPITIPPLRERKEDIPVLARHFLKEFARAQNKAPLKLDAQAINTLVAYPWPGNVRELRNIMQQLSLLCDGPVATKQDLPAFFYDPDWYLVDTCGEGSATRNATGIDSLDFQEVGPGLSLKDLKQRTWAHIEKQAISKALAMFENNRTRTAEHLGISRRTLHAKIKKYGI